MENGNCSIHKTAKPPRNTVTNKVCLHEARAVLGTVTKQGLNK
jgi:hypothetical protein